METLVVMAIVAIVVGIAVPVLYGTKAAANKSTCVVNLHQIEAGVSLYVVDYDDRLPYAIDEISRRERWDLTTRSDWPDFRDEVDRIPSITDVLMKYGVAREQYHCRMDRPILPAGGEGQGLIPAYYPRYGSSYKFTPTVRSYSVSALSEPSKQAHVYDADRFHSEPYDFRRNILHFDGHVAFGRTYHAGNL